MDSLLSGIYSLTMQDVEPFVMIVDVAIRSVLAVIVFRWWADKLRPSFSTQATCFELLGVLILVATLPVLPSVSGLIAQEQSLKPLLTLLVPGSTYSSVGQPGQEVSMFAMMIKIYVAGALAFVSVLLLSINRLSLLRRRAKFDLCDEDRLLLDAALASMEMRQSVCLALSEDVESPVSFGWIRPTILVPTGWKDWDYSVRSSVLKHELAHIQRSDWATVMLANIIVSISWYNPLAWYVRKQLILATEYASDALVLDNETCKYDYAEHLLWVARNIRFGGHSIAMTNPMVVATNLTDRVSRVLSDRKQEVRPRVRASLLTFITVSFLAALALIRIVSVQDSNLYRSPELLAAHRPLSATSYLWHGLYGYARVRFDVDEKGTVDANSIRIVSSTDSASFSGPVTEAVRQFRYAPRLVNGNPEATQGMEWTLTVKGYVASFASE